MTRAQALLEETPGTRTPLRQTTRPSARESGSARRSSVPGPRPRRQTNRCRVCEPAFHRQHSAVLRSPRARHRRPDRTPLTDRFDPTNARRHEPSLRLERVPGPVGGLRLRPGSAGPRGRGDARGLGQRVDPGCRRPGRRLVRPASRPRRVGQHRGRVAGQPSGRVPGHRP